MFGWPKKSALAEKPKTVGEVMDAYGALLEKNPMAIRDVSMLPIAKGQMKVVLKGLYAKSQTVEQKKLLETGFMFLANFQDGVGPVPMDGELRKDRTRRPTKSEIDKFDIYIAWQKMAAAEMDILLAEWKRFKAGEPIC